MERIRKPAAGPARSAVTSIVSPIGKFRRPARLPKPLELQIVPYLWVGRNAQQWRFVRTQTLRGNNLGRETTIRQLNVGKKRSSTASPNCRNTITPKPSRSLRSRPSWPAIPLLPGPKAARRRPKAEPITLHLLTFLHCSGHPELSRLPQVCRQTAIAVAAAYDSIGNPSRLTNGAVSKASLPRQ